MITMVFIQEYKVFEFWNPANYSSQTILIIDMNMVKFVCMLKGIN